MKPDSKFDLLFQRHMQEILDGIPSAISPKLTPEEPPSGEVTHAAEEVGGSATPQVHDLVKTQPVENVSAVVPEKPSLGFIDQLVHKVLNFLKWLLGLFSKKPASLDTKEALAQSVAMATTDDDEPSPSEEKIQAVTAELAREPYEIPGEIPDAPPGLFGTTDEERMIALMRILAPLRTEFVCTCLFSDGVSQAQQKAAVRHTLGTLNSVRNTWAAQKFLIKYPHFFTSIDRRIYAEVRKKGYPVSRCALITN